MSLLPQDNELARYEEMNSVVELYVQNINPTKIARDLGLRRVDVLAHIEDWKNTAIGSGVMQDRIETLIASMDEHYSRLIRKAYEIIDEVDELKKSDKETMTRSQMLSQKKGALDLIAKLEKERIDMLQRAGITGGVGDQLAEMEEKYNRVMDLLDEHLCDTCTTKILPALQNEFSGSVVVVNG